MFGIRPIKTIFNYDYFAEELRYNRESNGITTRGLAEELGTTSATVSRIENYHIQPRLDTILKVCNYFDLEVRDFFDEVVNND